MALTDSTAPLFCHRDYITSKNTPRSCEQPTICISLQRQSRQGHICMSRYVFSIINHRPWLLLEIKSVHRVHIAKACKFKPGEAVPVVQAVQSLSKFTLSPSDIHLKILTIIFPIPWNWNECRVFSAQLLTDAYFPVFYRYRPTSTGPWGGLCQIVSQQHNDARSFFSFSRIFCLG